MRRSIITLFIILILTTPVNGIDTENIGVSVGEKFKYYVHDLYTEGVEPSKTSSKLINLPVVIVRKNDTFELEIETIPEDSSGLGSVTIYINDKEHNFIGISFYQLMEYFIYTDWDFWTSKYNYEGQDPLDENITYKYVATLYDTYFYISSEMKSTYDDSLYSNSTVYYGLNGAIKVFSMIIKENSNITYKLNISDDEKNSDFIVEDNNEIEDPELDISNSIDNIMFPYLLLTSIFIVIMRKKKR